MNDTTPMGSIAAMKSFFGLKPDQGLKQFADEVKQLTPEDREEIRLGLIKLGYNII